MRATLFTRGFVAGVLFVGAGVATAGPVDLAATNRGYVEGDSQGTSRLAFGSSATSVYRAGRVESGSGSFATSFSSRNWFIFDLTGIMGTVTSAELRLDARLVSMGHAGRPFAYDVTTTTASVGDLIGEVGGSTIFDALGTGTLLASLSNLDFSNRGSTLVLSMNAAGLAHINSNLGGLVVFSGLVKGNSAFVSRIFEPNPLYPSNSTTLSMQVDNPVIPLPTGAAMAVVGMGVIGVRRRRPIS